jgi:glycosyltransferase involved in cell wall biosynthesis
MDQRGTLIIVPALNEERSIPLVVKSLLDSNLDVLVIDDCSTDQTSQLARSLGARVLSLPLNLGVGGALRAGFRYAVDNGYESVVQVDADGQHPIHQIPELESAALANDAQLVIGSRFLGKNSTLTPSAARRFSMWFLSVVASRIAGTSLSDTTSGFRLIREPLLSEFARNFPSYYLGDTYEATIAALRAGYRVIEVPADLSERAHGKSTAGPLRASLLIAKVLTIAIFGLHHNLKRYSE